MLALVVWLTLKAVSVLRLSREACAPPWLPALVVSPFFELHSEWRATWRAGCSESINQVFVGNLMSTVRCGRGCISVIYINFVPVQPQHQFLRTNLTANHHHVYIRSLCTAWDSEIESLTSLNPSLIELYWVADVTESQFDRALSQKNAAQAPSDCGVGPEKELFLSL